ncbi:MAG TPA: sigma-54-dependent Fis family transcriptional regulator [Methylococcaceae bacterium]|nr:sigma-54-dependent Fis family transcriptional regulator [Methylococcaceae bacterium]
MNKFSNIIGQSPLLESVVRSAQMIAFSDVGILIKGPTGTGKDILATAIQQSGPRAEQPFIKINCATLPEEIVESELFGHKKGAFTGADSDQEGLLQAAHQGTLFLDEIDSLALSVQAKLLRFLESGECLPVGSTQAITLDVRVISATNSDLDDKINQGLFRSDLYFRLNVVPLELPALNQRTEDINDLCAFYLKKFASQYGVQTAKFSALSLKQLRGYSWPGNIRELKNLCERVSVLLPGKTLEPENLPKEFVSQLTTQPKGGISILPEAGINLDALEADLIHQALTRTNGNRSKSARLLGISRDTLLYRIQKHALSTR